MKQIFQHKPGPLKQIIIPVTDDFEPLSLQNLRSTLVAHSTEMLASIYLDDHSRFETNEIKNIFLKRKLTPEFQAFETAVAQQAPHRGFGLGWPVAHASRVATHHLANRAMVRFQGC